jgi:transposase InsO family protein
VIPILYHLFELEETVICGLPDMDMASDKWRENLLPAIQSSRYRELLPKSGGGSRGGKVESIQFGNGDCWDNAVMESFWATLKTELVSHERYATRKQARASIFEYIEVFYNRQRLHSLLGYKCPETFEAGLN